MSTGTVPYILVVLLVSSTWICDACRMRRWHKCETPGKPTIIGKGHDNKEKLKEFTIQVLKGMMENFNRKVKKEKKEAFINSIKTTIPTAIPTQRTTTTITTTMTTKNIVITATPPRNKPRNNYDRNNGRVTDNIMSLMAYVDSVGSDTNSEPTQVMTTHHGEPQQSKYKLYPGDSQPDTPDNKGRSGRERMNELLWKFLMPKADGHQLTIS